MQYVSQSFCLSTGWRVTLWHISMVEPACRNYPRRPSLVVPIYHSSDRLAVHHCLPAYYEKQQTRKCTMSPLCWYESDVTHTCTQHRIIVNIARAVMQSGIGESDHHSISIITSMMSQKMFGFSMVHKMQGKAVILHSFTGLCVHIHNIVGLMQHNLILN